MKSKITFFVEGPMEKALIDSLDLLGNAIVYNLTQNPVEKKLITLGRSDKRNKQIVYIVFDIDVINECDRLGILLSNIRKLEERNNEVYIIQQTRNLEDELCKAGYRNMKRLLNSFGVNSVKDFKSEFCRVTKLGEKLKRDKFSPDLLWDGNLIDELASISKKQRKYSQLHKKIELLYYAK